MPDYFDWPENFPPVTHFIDEQGNAKPWRIMTGHLDYEAAKNHEDLDAAQRLVRHFLNTPWAREGLIKIARNYPNAIITPIHAVETKGKNKIPYELAHYIANATGLQSNDSIIQINIVQRTGNDAIYRLAFRPQFDGQVQAGRPYILVDDVFSNGGSFSELRQYIEQNGGNVVHTAAMTTGGHGNIIALTPQTMVDLERKFGVDSLIDFCTEVGLYGGNYKALTEPEAFFLARSPSLDAARDRIAQARLERDRGILPESFQRHQTPDRTVSPDPRNNTLHSPESLFDNSAPNDRLSRTFQDEPPAASRPARDPDDFISKTIIKTAEPQGLYTVIGKKITLTEAGRPSAKGWQELYDALAMYRDKHFETSRYIFINDNGEIADHLAISFRHPVKAPSAPTELPNDRFVHSMNTYAEKNGYGIVFCHNHPSGNPNPSAEDIAVTEQLKINFGSRFKGHIILDHGTFSFCDTTGDWVLVNPERDGQDPLLDIIPGSFLGSQIHEISDLALFRAALQVDGGHTWNNTNWVPVVFSNIDAVVTSLHYYHKSDFTRNDGSGFLIDKTVKIAESTGSTWAFPITDDIEMVPILRRLHREIHLFTDFYAHGENLDPYEGQGSIISYFNSTITYTDSTFPVLGNPARQNKHSRHAAETALASPLNPGAGFSVPRDDLLTWAAVNTPALRRSLITLENNISGVPAYKKKKVANLKREQNELLGNLKQIYHHLELEKFDPLKFQSSVDTIFGLKNIETLRHSLVYFGHVPEILTGIGLPNSSLYMKTGHVFTSMKEHAPSGETEPGSFNYHNISPDLIKQIPESLKNPLYVLQSKHFPASLVVVLDLYDKNDNPVIAPIAPFRVQSLYSCQLRYSAISSVYGKSNFELFLKNHENFILYERENGSRLFRPRERQSPRVAWDHFNSGPHSESIQHYKNTVKDYVVKTGIMDPLFLAEPQAPYGTSLKKNKEQIMYDFSGNVSALPPSGYSAVIEYLEKLGKMKNMEEIKRFYGPLVSNPDFTFINEYIPPPGDRPFAQYHAMIAQLHAKGLQHFRGLYPDRPEPGHLDYSQYPIPHAEGPSASPHAFMESAQSIRNPQEYESFYNRYYQFVEGSIKALSPRQIAFFQGNNKIPSAILENTPENWTKLFNRANNLNIAVNNIIPHPKDLYDVSMLHEAFTTLNNNMSKEYHTHDFSRRETLAEPQVPYPQASSPDTAKPPAAAAQGALFRKHQIFVQHAYVPGTEVPHFGEFSGDHFLSYEGYQFARTENANQTIILQKNGKETSVSSTLYNQIITNTKDFLTEKEITPDIVEKYEQTIGADRDKTRNNTAANYWHNFRVLCREQASTPAEAMEIAKSIVKEMPCEEQEKFKSHIKSYAKTSRPPETYNQHILRFYEENVKDLPINESIFTRDSIPSVNRTVEITEKRGASIDPRLRIKIGDMLDMNVKIDDLFKDKKRTVNTKNLILVSASSELNKVVLVDKDNHSKYVLARDEFVNHVEKLEKRQKKAAKKERIYESVGY
jgi:proteasome lid subunit RPN8/RPN11